MIYRWILTELELEDNSPKNSLQNNQQIWEYYSDGIGISFAKTPIRARYCEQQMKDFIRAGRIELVTGAEADRLTEQFNNIKISLL